MTRGDIRIIECVCGGGGGFYGIYLAHFQAGIVQDFEVMLKDHLSITDRVFPAVDVSVLHDSLRHLGVDDGPILPILPAVERADPR